jgi:hypothetical protein
MRSRGESKAKSGKAYLTGMNRMKGIKTRRRF